VPTALKIILLSLAIFDDLAAILIIAVFYSTHIALSWLAGASALLVILLLLNHRKVMGLGLYLVIGSFLWYCILKSGIHPTIAGVLLAFCIPFKTGARLEHLMHPWVAFGVLPIFAFFNAGVSLSGLSLGAFNHPVTLGIMLGLFLGKQMGVLLFSWVAIQLKWCSLPDTISWLAYYGMAVLTGIGFTMSLFVGILAFPEIHYQTAVRIGVISGSVLSGVMGYAVLRYAARKV
jgi:NhaA family Na+:H+ antiporter